MAENEPVAEQSCHVDVPSRTSRAGAKGPMDDPDTYWLSTLRDDGRPAIVPVLGVWLDGALHIAVSEAMHEPGTLGTTHVCAITTDPRGLDLVVKGAAVRVLDEGKLTRLAGAYTTKYRTAVHSHDGAFHSGGVRAAGPSPYDVYEVTPAVPPEPGTGGGTRWSF
jgi:hypothetical protein